MTSTPSTAVYSDGTHLTSKLSGNRVICAALMMASPSSLARGRSPHIVTGIRPPRASCGHRADVDFVLEECRRLQAKDARLRIKEYEDLIDPTVFVHAFASKEPIPVS